MPAVCSATSRSSVEMRVSGSADISARATRYVLMNTAFGDLVAILGIIEFIRPDKWIFRLVARRQPTQQTMNEMYMGGVNSDLYLPFRYQLILKWVFLTLMFCPAFPLLLP